jgi:hypothetical protein
VPIKPKGGDFVILAVILIVAIANLGMFMHRGDGDTVAMIIKDGRIIKEIKLNELKDPLVIKNEGIYNSVIVAENGRIRFEESDCPDKVCVKTGWISRPGQTSVCLPAGIIIKIVGESGDTDIILR